MVRRYVAVWVLLLILTGSGVAAHAFTRRQAAAAATTAQGEVLVRLNAQLAARVKLDGLVRQRAEAVAKARAMAGIKRSVSAETQARMQAAEKAATANAQVVKAHSGTTIPEHPGSVLDKSGHGEPIKPELSQSRDQQRELGHEIAHGRPYVASGQHR